MTRAEAVALASRAAALPQIISASPRRSGGSWSVHIEAVQGVTVWHDAGDDSRWNPPALRSVYTWQEEGEGTEIYRADDPQAARVVWVPRPFEQPRAYHHQHVAAIVAALETEAEAQNDEAADAAE